MSKATKPGTNVVDPVTANDSLNKLHLGQEAPVDIDEAFDIVDKADVSKMQDLSSEYFKFEQKGVYLFAVLGVSTATINSKEIEVVEIMDKSKTKYINGDKVLVGAAKKLTQLPCFIKVEYKGDIKNANGTYKDLKVYTFPSNVK